MFKTILTIIIFNIYSFKQINKINHITQYTISLFKEIISKDFSYIVISIIYFTESNKLEIFSYHY
jgi:hypothetical protein